MTKLAIARTFDHVTLGRIGVAELSCDVTGATLGGKPLPDASVEYLLNYGLQCLMDAYAGIGKSKTEDEGRAAFDKKYASLVDGTAGVRVGGPSEPAINRFVREVVRVAVEAKAGKGDAKAKTHMATFATFKKEKGDSDERIKIKAAGRRNLWSAVFDAMPDESKAKVMAVAERKLAEFIATKAKDATVDVEI